MLAALVLYQAGHHTEHTIETVQLKFLDHRHAHTLLSGVDFEWVHLAANAVLEYGLVAALVAAGADVRRRWRTQFPWGWRALVFAAVLQGAHVVDHAVRAAQYVASGGATPTGTVTRWVDPVWFHFTMNLVVLLAIVVAFLGLRAWRGLARRGRSLALDELTVGPATVGADG